MTEEEARTKWCPFVRLGSTVTGLGGFNRDNVDGPAIYNESANCITSDCMAWRLEPYVNQPGNSIRDRRGYCGLAR